MDYLEQAKEWIGRSIRAIEADNHEGEQLRATVASAYAAIAIAERLDVLLLTDEIARLNFPEKLANIVLTNTNLIGTLQSQIDKLEIDLAGHREKTIDDGLVLSSLNNQHANRIDDLEQGLRSVGVWLDAIELSESDYISMRTRLDEIAQTVTENGVAILELERNLDNKL